MRSLVRRDMIGSFTHASCRLVSTTRIEVQHMIARFDDS
jgi:hypothetical protein